MTQWSFTHRYHPPTPLSGILALRVLHGFTPFTLLTQVWFILSWFLSSLLQLLTISHISLCFCPFLQLRGMAVVLTVSTNTNLISSCCSVSEHQRSSTNCILKPPQFGDVIALLFPICSDSDSGVFTFCFVLDMLGRSPGSFFSCHVVLSCHRNASVPFNLSSALVNTDAQCCCQIIIDLRSLCLLQAFH